MATQMSPAPVVARRAPSARLFALLGHLVDVVLLAVIAVGVGGTILGRVLPALDHPVYVVAGPSMTPAIPVGAAVILDRVDAASLAVGDVVSLQSGPQRSVFTHRITRLVPRDDGLWIETKGDANEHVDPSITPASAVVGRVAVALPYAGYGIVLLSSVPGVVMVLSTGLLLIVLGWWIDAIATDRRRARALAGAALAPAASSPGRPG